MPERARLAETKHPAPAFTMFETTFNHILADCPISPSRVMLLYNDSVLILEDSSLQTELSVMATEENCGHSCFCLTDWCRYFCDTL